MRFETVYHERCRLLGYAFLAGLITDGELQLACDVWQALDERG